MTSKGDLISRQAVENITWEEPSYTDPWNVLTEVRDKVRALPSIENKGEWIPVYGKNGKTIMSYKCSKCMFHPKHAIITDFCGGCGADMRGGKE